MKSKNAPQPEARPARLARLNLWLVTLSAGGQLLLAILFYEWLGLSALLYAGWLLIAAALLLVWRARIDFTNGSTVTPVVSTGVYAIVRHPMSLAFMLLSLGLAAISQTWLSAALCFVVLFTLYDDLRREEIDTLARYGQDYADYIERVPRLNFSEGLIAWLGRH